MDKRPVKLIPAFKDYLWGGEKLKTEYNKKTDLETVAESWELSTHHDGESLIADGPYKGLKLSEYIEKNGTECIGSRAAEFDFFPILIKLIDAKAPLSIQVHPSDEYALANECEYGKTEMWYIMDCDEGAFIYYGLDRAVTKEEFEERIKNNTVLEVLNKAEVHKGDVFFISSGTIHAINAGIVICEIQQNSNTTYRVYDYDRRDKNGNTRPLHIKKALDVARLAPPEDITKTQNGNILAKCKYFTAEKLVCNGEAVLNTDRGCFRCVTAVDGSGTIICGDSKTEFIKGESIFIPAADETYIVSGKCELIISYV